MVNRISSIVSLDHKVIGLGYILLGIFCGLVGVCLSYAIRVELLVPGYFFLSGSELCYYSLVSSHGIIMIFFSAMPIFISGFGNFFIPLMVGCKDLAFPRLNNLAIYLLLCSFIILFYASGGLCTSPSGFSYGWTMYPPLSTSSSNFSLDFLILSLHLNGISSLLNSLNSIVTIHFKSFLNKYHLSIFSWSIYIVSWLLLLVTPVLVVGITVLLTDHLIGTCFYSTSGGGDPLLFQHLFWFFGHPEVYILILPVFGLISEIISEYSIVRILGHNLLVWSMLSIAFIGCFVWGHHMYTVGLDVNSKCYFTIITSLIAIPTGLKVVLWMSSFMDRDFSLDIITWFVFSFMFSFIFGGFTGIWLAQSTLDLLLHDTYFVTAHFHYVLAISLVYVFFAIIYNWFYFITGLFFNKLYSFIHLLTFFIGSNLLFFPMHIVGLSGLPRRVFDYPSCFLIWNQISSLGLFLVLVSLLWFALALSPFVRLLLCQYKVTRFCFII